MKYTGVSIPDEVLSEIDEVAKGWFTNRSKALVRIYLEWKQLQGLAQFPHPPTDNGDAEAPSAPVKKNPNTVALAA